MVALPFDVDPNEGRRLQGHSAAPGHFRLWRAAKDIYKDEWRLHCLLGATPPRPVRGYGGWTQLQREGRRSLSTFEGTETPAYVFELRLDRHRPNPRPVAEQMRNLERLCGWDRFDDNPPPPLQFVANVAHDYDEASQNEWVCESLEWGDSIASDRGTVLWQDATLTLGLYVETTVPNLGKSPGFARHELKVGWDLRDFARRHLGDPKRWKDVAALNRDNPRCPSSPSFKPKRAVWLLTPPREPKSKRAKRGRR